MVSPFGSAPRLMMSVIQEGETQYWMPKAFMTLFLDFTMNKPALSVSGRILFSKMVIFLIWLKKSGGMMMGRFDLIVFHCVMY